MKIRRTTPNKEAALLREEITTLMRQLGEKCGLAARLAELNRRQGVEMERMQKALEEIDSNCQVATEGYSTRGSWAAVRKIALRGLGTKA